MLDFITIGIAIVALSAAAACYRRLVQERRKMAALAMECAELCEREQMLSGLSADLGDLLAHGSQQSQAALHATHLALQIQQDCTDALITALPQAALVHREGLVILANPAAAQLLGLDPAHILGTPLSRYLAPETSKTKDGQGLGPRQRNVERADHSELWVEAQEVELLLDGQGATLVLLRDVQASERMRSQMHLANRMTSLGSLVSAIAHELNNPMSYVLANLEMLRDEICDRTLAAEHKQEMLEMLDESFHGAIRVSQLVTELQKFSRPPASAAASLSSVIKRAEAIAGSTLRSRAVLNIDIQSDALLPQGADQLVHVLVNLLLNATAAVEPNREREENQVSLHAECVNNEVILQVRDNGRSIPPDLRENIFDPFFATESAPRTAGMSLPICNSIVSALGGKLELLSEAQAQTVLQIRLPESLWTHLPQAPEANQESRENRPIQIG